MYARARACSLRLSVAIIMIYYNNNIIIIVTVAEVTIIKY